MRDNTSSSRPLPCRRDGTDMHLVDAGEYVVGSRLEGWDHLTVGPRFPLRRAMEMVSCRAANLEGQAGCGDIFGHLEVLVVSIIPSFPLDPESLSRNQARRDSRGSSTS